MIEPVLKAFEGLLSDFTWRRLTALVVLTTTMRHWYLLAESSLGAHRHQCASDSAIVAHHGPHPCESLSSTQRAKMFWLGLVESTPLFTGGMFAAYSDSVASSSGWATGAIISTIILCWCLRHQTPDTRIELTSTRDRGRDAEEEATREV